MIRSLIDKFSGMEIFLRKGFFQYRESYFIRMLAMLFVALVFFIVSGGEEPFYSYFLLAFLFEFMTINLIYERDFYPLGSFLNAYFSEGSFWYNFIYIFFYFLFWGVVFYLL